METKYRLTIPAASIRGLSRFNKKMPGLVVDLFNQSDKFECTPALRESVENGTDAGCVVWYGKTALNAKRKPVIPPEFWVDLNECLLDCEGCLSPLDIKAFISGKRFATASIAQLSETIAHLAGTDSKTVQERVKRKCGSDLSCAGIIAVCVPSVWSGRDVEKDLADKIGIPGVRLEVELKPMPAKDWE